MGVAAAGADAPRMLYCKEEDKSLGRAAHERNVQGPVVVSAMYRSGVLGNASMKQVQALWDLTCVGDELGWYVSNFCVCVLLCLPSGCVYAAMLRLREACCIVALGDGVPVEARCSGTCLPWWCAHVPCYGCRLLLRPLRAAARPPKCERMWHHSN